MTAEGRITAGIEGAAGYLTIDNPRRHNALSMAMWEAIPAAMESLNADPAVRAIFIRGAGSAAFVSGADISEFERVRADATISAAYEAANADAFAAIRQSRRPTIALIRGVCMGGGVGIAVAADYRIATDDASFAIPAARLGLAYPPEAIADIVALIGPSKTRHLIFTARRIDAAEALAIGLVDRVVAAADLEAAAASELAAIAALAPLTLTAAKSAVAAALAPKGSPLATRAADEATACFDSEDYAEGRRAFLEKRQPIFRGS